MAGAVLVGSPAAAGAGDIGYQGPSFSGVGAGGHPSGTKPESKVWWNDGIWWADMFPAVADARVSEAAPTTNYGTATTLRVVTATSSWHTYVRFSVTGVSGTIVGAKLRFHVTDSSPDGGTVFSTSSAWSEVTVSTAGPVLTWSTAPPAGTRVGAAGAVTASTWVDIDLGTAVTGNGTYSFVLASNSSNSAIYDSRETTNPPQLILAKG